jgi:GrpB-like predicted nucleotidyltransferase (UPF0157 family)
VIEHDHPHARALIAFLGVPRADPKLRKEYARRKRQLADQFRDNRNAFGNAKATSSSKRSAGSASSRPHATLA